MAATNIPFDRSNQFGQEIKSLLNAYRKVTDDGPDILQSLTHMIDGDGSDASHYQVMVDNGIFSTTTDAMEAFNELAAANAKVTTDDSVSGVQAALRQCCAKFGII